MKAKVAIAVVIIVAFILAIFIFDWGRGTVIAPDITETSTSSPLVVSYPQDNQEVTSPIKIKGKARGTWFFEAVFSVQLVDSLGNIISTGQARAEDDWMTTDYVNFSAEIEYPSTTTGSALIILSKDNPSDNPDFDQHIFVPVILK